MKDLKEFQFSYRFDNKTWGITIFARNADEAKQKIQAVAQAKYDGEIVAQIYVPQQLSILARCWLWLKG